MILEKFVRKLLFFVQIFLIGIKTEMLFYFCKEKEKIDRSRMT